MATDVQIGVEYDTPSQPPDNGDGLGLGSRVTRQVGLSPTQLVGPDPVPPQPVIQGDPNTVVVRNAGPHVRGHFDASGVFFADHVADTAQVLYADGGVREGVSNQPPGLARIAAPLVADPNQPVPPRPAFDAASSAPPAVPPSMDKAAIKAMAQAAGFIVHDAPGEVKDSPVAFDVVASDTGSNDPRDASSGPAVFTADQLPVIKKAPIVPVVIAAPKALPEPRTRHIRAKAGPTAKSVKKGGKK